VAADTRVPVIVGWAGGRPGESPHRDLSAPDPTARTSAGRRQPGRAVLNHSGEVIEATGGYTLHLGRVPRWPMPLLTVYLGRDTAESPRSAVPRWSALANVCAEAIFVGAVSHQRCAYCLGCACTSYGVTAATSPPVLTVAAARLPTVRVVP
jgi:hypothetical protein